MAERICSHKGCALPVRAQGLCRQHHDEFLRADPANRAKVRNRAAILAAMPARNSAIIKKTGLHPETVRRILIELREAGQAHIGHHIPPCKPGSKFAPVFVRGPGKDAVVDKKAKHEQLLRTMRRGHHRRKALKIGQKIPAGAGWAAMLFVR